MPDTCTICRYYHGPIDHWGKCRRRAPVLTSTGTAWPDVHYGDWCGEFEFRLLTKAIEHLEDAPQIAKEDWDDDHP